MRLAYLVIGDGDGEDRGDGQAGGGAGVDLGGATAGGPPAVLVHGQGQVIVEPMVEAARRIGLDGPVVVPFGDYATTASGMEVGGPCWYRSLPGDAGTDPLTLARAVLQLADTVAASGVDHPVLVGWRQGAAVALGTALLEPEAVSGVVAVDAPAAHLPLLPARLTVASGPPVLLVSTGEAAGADQAAAREELGRRGLTVDALGTTSGRSGEAAGAEAAGGDNEGDETWSGAARPVVEAWTRRAVAEGSPP